MSSQLFIQRCLPLLSQPESWRLIASFLDQPTAVTDPERLAWSNAHAHAHAYREILITLRGDGVYGCHDRLHRCTPVTVIFFDAHEPHDFGYPPGADTVEHLWLVVLPAQLFIRHLEVRNGAIPADAPTWVLDTPPAATRLSESWDWARGSRHLPHSLRRLRLVGALSDIISATAELDLVEGPGERLRVQETAVDAVCQHLRETAGRGASLDTLARMAGYSRFHFLRVFKRHTGCTVLRYIDRCRLHRARDLQAANYTQQAIADELGFASPSSFSRWLRRQR